MAAESLKRAREMELSRVKRARFEDLASMVRLAFDTMRAIGEPPNDWDRAQAKRLLTDELFEGSDRDEAAEVSERGRRRRIEGCTRVVR